ncbi:MAG TPA: 4a-hydroxytetrahydrobiopterin dehydratase [Kiritimatiellia bacterium]|nr:4a-hydroxytetrahydrobiopterin dehydratase [Kiritimatiellia bacterium]HMO99444.1 4a-hydroxytetrahydrobiopterin dehydratase [Kiritimatiellia bacterium]HMP97377.1 4a-hydroxytetrahydrobiopterin dehydratase [Kiritimatiellia bacterium]
METEGLDLTRRRCRPCENGMAPLSEEEINRMLNLLPEWHREGNEIIRTWSFKNYYQTVAFINAVAWLAHREDHHPDIAFGYKTATIRYSTHAIGGLSENDFICAAKIDALTV